MFVQLLAFGAALNAFSTAALPLSTSDLSQSTTPDISNEIRTIPEYDWTSSYVSDFTIHSSCNATERRELTSGLNEAVLLAEHAKQHVLVHGNTSSIFQKYFGKGPTGVVIGWLDKIASGNRAGILFRCDDIDQNCATQDGWAGHHRGSNASAETVICPLSYTTRRYLSSVCARGFDMATGRPADYWAADLMHRLYHVPLVGEDVVDHYADGYNGVLDLAQGENYTFAGSNSATLTYFALEAYAYDIAVPGEGCVGKPVEDVDSGHGSASASTTASTTSQSTTTLATTETATVNPVRVITTESTSTSATAIATETGGQECHTHDDGTLHCV